MGRCASFLLIFYFSQGVVGGVQNQSVCLYTHATTLHHDPRDTKRQLTYSYSIILKIPYRKKERIRENGTLCIVYFFS